MSSISENYSSSKESSDYMPSCIIYVPKFSIFKFVTEFQKKHGEPAYAYIRQDKKNATTDQATVKRHIFLLRFSVYSFSL